MEQKMPYSIFCDNSYGHCGEKVDKKENWTCIRGD